MDSYCTCRYIFPVRGFRSKGEKHQFQPEWCDKDDCIGYIVMALPVLPFVTYVPTYVHACMKAESEKLFLAHQSVTKRIIILTGRTQQGHLACIQLAVATEAKEVLELSRKTGDTYEHTCLDSIIILYFCF